MYHGGLTLLARYASTIARAIGSDVPFDPRLQALRGQPGQIAVAAILRDLLEGVSWTPVSEPETLLVHVIAPKVEEEPEAEEAAAEAVEEGAQPEVIKKGKAEAGEEPAQSQ